MSDSRPPPLPSRRHDPLPNPLQYAQGNFPARWSPWPLTIAGALYGLLVTAAAYMECRFIPLFRDFKVEMPWIAQVIIVIARLIWQDYVWVALIPLLIAAPAVTVPFVPVPSQPESRRRVARTAAYILILIFVMTIIVVVLSIFTPMIALIKSVSGPQKK
jgi:hypothetical protein